jgi:hypothetical protein
MMRVLADHAAIYLWLAVMVMGVAAMWLVGDAGIFIMGWAAGGLVAAVLVAAKTRDGQ